MEIYESKHLKGYSILDPSLLKKQGCSSTWRGVLYSRNLLSQGLLWRIGIGDGVKF